MIVFIISGIILAYLWAWEDKNRRIIGVHWRRGILRSGQYIVLGFAGTLFFEWPNWSTVLTLAAKGTVLVAATFYLLFDGIKNKMEGKSLLYVGREAATDCITRKVWGTLHEFGGLIQKLIIMVAAMWLWRIII